MTKLFIILLSIVLIGCSTQGIKKQQLILEVHPELLLPPKDLIKL